MAKKGHPLHIAVIAKWNTAMERATANGRSQWKAMAVDGNAACGSDIRAQCYNRFLIRTCSCAASCMKLTFMKVYYVLGLRWAVILITRASTYTYTYRTQKLDIHARIDIYLLCQQLVYIKDMCACVLALPIPWCIPDAIAAACERHSLSLGRPPTYIIMY